MINIDKESFTWRAIEIPNWDQIYQELQILPSVIHRENPIFWASRDIGIYQQHLPTLFKWFDEKSLVVEMIAYVRIFKNFQQNHHRDLGYTLALQLPIINCESVYTGFYTTTDRAVFTKNSNHIYLNYPLQNMVEYDRYYLKGPLLADVSKIHSVQNFTDQERHAISVRFTEPPWSLLLDN